MSYPFYLNHFSVPLYHRPRIVLTARGRELQEPLDRVLDQINFDFLSKFPPEDARRLRDLLRIVAK